MKQSIFIFRGLRKTFAHRVLLDLPELALYPGQCTLLSGENGAGKTTLLRIIAGLLEPDGCAVEYHQRWYEWRKIRRILQAQIVYVHQQPYLFDATVSANIEYGLKQMRLSRTDRRARTREALSWAGLEHLADRAARTLSSGEQQRVALTRARVLTPHLLLLDEPLANMDNEARSYSCELIARLRDEGTGIIITGHEQGRLKPLADRLLLLHEGHISEQADAAAEVIPLPQGKRPIEH